MKNLNKAKEMAIKPIIDMSHKVNEIKGMPDIILEEFLVEKIEDNGRMITVIFVLLLIAISGIFSIILFLLLMGST